MVFAWSAAIVSLPLLTLNDPPTYRISSLIMRHGPGFSLENRAGQGSLCKGRGYKIRYLLEDRPAVSSFTRATLSCPIRSAMTSVLYLRDHFRNLLE